MDPYVWYKINTGIRFWAPWGLWDTWPIFNICILDPFGPFWDPWPLYLIFLFLILGHFETFLDINGHFWIHFCLSYRVHLGPIGQIWVSWTPWDLWDPWPLYNICILDPFGTFGTLGPLLYLYPGSMRWGQMQQQRRRIMLPFWDLHRAGLVSNCRSYR